MSSGETREAALVHLRLVGAHPGYWELRALQRLDAGWMEARGCFFLIATATTDGLIYDRLGQAVDWAEEHAWHAVGLFVGMNPREREARGKDSVKCVTSCYVDLALAELSSSVDHLVDNRS